MAHDTGGRGGRFRFPAFAPTRMMTPRPGERVDGRPIMVGLLCLALVGVGVLARTGIECLVGMAFPTGLWGLSAAGIRLAASLLGTAVTVVCVILWCRLREKRRYVRVGLSGRGIASECGIGALGGLILLAGAVGICTAGGGLDVMRGEHTPVGWVILFGLLFIVQGFSEELLFRAHLMAGLSGTCPLWGCVVINASLFSLLHLFNSGIGVISVINTFLFGVLMSLLVLRRGSIWMAGMVHAMWNFAEGCLFGGAVSGLHGAPSVLVTVVRVDAPAYRFLCGGSYGPEGGLAVTVVLSLGLLAVVLWPTKRTERDL